MAEQPLKQLETSLRLVGTQGRETLTVGPFEAFISASQNPLMSFATPHTEVSEWSGAIDELKHVFSGRGRRARLEYFYELYPSLTPALEQAGFKQDNAAPVMTLTQGELASSARTHSAYRRLGADEGERLREFLGQQSVAYGGMGGEDALAWLPQLIAGLKSGVVIVAGLEQNGLFVSGATIQLGGEVGELAGVWTRPELQKQGLAFTLCRQLLTDYFAAGYELCWLSAAEGAVGLYQKLGFRRVGTQHNYSFGAAE